MAWGAALLIALLAHISSLPSVGRWANQRFDPTPELAPLSLDLSSFKAPEKAKPKPKHKRQPPQKERLPDEEQVLSSKPDQITPNTRNSAPKGGAAEFGTKASNSKQTKLDELKNALKLQAPESTGKDGLKFAINSYQWNYKRFMQNWAVALSKRWVGSTDYLRGDYPDGGFVWVKITLGRDGHLEGYEVMDQNVSPDMALMVVYAVMGVRNRPPLPDDFPKDKLVAYWRFIYPTFEELKAMINQSKGQP